MFTLLSNYKSKDYFSFHEMKQYKKRKRTVVRLCVLYLLNF